MLSFGQLQDRSRPISLHAHLSPAESYILQLAADHQGPATSAEYTISNTGSGSAGLPGVCLDAHARAYSSAAHHLLACLSHIYADTPPPPYHPSPFPRTRPQYGQASITCASPSLRRNHPISPAPAPYGMLVLLSSCSAFWPGRCILLLPCSNFTLKGLLLTQCMISSQASTQQQRRLESSNASGRWKLSMLAAAGLPPLC